MPPAVKKTSSKDIKIESRKEVATMGQVKAYAEGMKKMPYVLNQLGFESLRPGQDRAVKSIMTGRDSVVILPTSLGKSACFVVPTLCMGWKTIIIYPLIALMRDQSTSMQRKGLAAATISSAETDGHNASVLRDWAAGDLQFMLVSPERFANPEWANVVRQYPPDFVALDECHTFADWADTFRPGYKSAGLMIQDVAPKVVAAFSATLSSDAEAECRAGLGIEGAELIYHYPRRTNLHLSSLFTENQSDQYQWLLENCPGATIVYASTTKRVELYASTLQSYTDRDILFYHGKMSTKDRTYQQDKFMASPDAIIVATCAFGMGVDKGDIRSVVHFDIPGTLVAYTQEFGRAGRDGADSFCTIIPTKEGVRTQRHFIRCGSPSQEDIRKFWAAAKSMREGSSGIITAKRDDIARQAGVDTFAVQSIMAFCHGERMFINDESAARKSRVRFAENIPSLTPTDKKARDAIYDIGLEGDDGWVQINLDELAEQLSRAPQTVAGHLRKMSSDGKIEWVRPSTSKPLRLGLSPDDIPAEAFRRLDDKARSAEADLQLVLTYANQSDDMKHTFLEQHLNR